MSKRIWSKPLGTGLNGAAKPPNGKARTLTTLVLSSAQCYLAYLWADGSGDAAAPFAALAPMTSLALAFWFKPPGTA